MLFAARIHNSRLGTCIEVENTDDGIGIIKDWIKEQELPFTEEDEEDLVNTYEYYNDDDSDNIYTFVVGSTS